MNIFGRFLDLLFPPRDTERLVREAPEDALVTSLNPQLLPLPGGEALGLLSYKNPLVKACVLEAKYRGNAKACQMLGFVLATYLAERATKDRTFGERALAVMPIPLSKKRLAERGYNQAERITACALSRLGLKDAPQQGILERVRDTPSQTKLSRSERLKNVEGAFTAHDIDPSFDYVIVDDVVTTGATLAEAARAVRTASATSVTCIALAH